MVQPSSTSQRQSQNTLKEKKSVLRKADGNVRGIKITKTDVLYITFISYYHLAGCDMIYYSIENAY